MRGGSLRVAWSFGALGVALVAAGLLLPRGEGPMLALLGALLLVAAGATLVPRWLFRFRWRALGRAFEEEDPARAEAILDKLSRMRLSPKVRMLTALARASAVMLDDRHHEARTILERIDPEAVAPPLRAVLRNDLAWALAHDGAPEEAMVLAELAFETRGPDASESLSSCCVGTLGVAQLKAGRLAEARETLERALALGGSPRLVATRAFYLGETFAALGHTDEAHGAYGQAVAATPKGRYGEKARAALATLSLSRPYRG